VTSNRSKYILLVGTCLVVGALDQWTKQWADAWLANPYTDPPHPVVFTVGPDEAGKPLRDVLGARLSWSRTEEVELLASRHTRVGGKRLADAGAPLKAGDEVKVQWRIVEVLPHVWHFRFARNRGAAFGLMNDMDPRYRRTFFIGVSLLAVVLILMIFRKVGPGQLLTAISLSLILSGALGNFIDRVRLHYVIDFIDWHWKDVYHWPTFNIADSAITVGVVLLFLEMLFGPKGELGSQDKRREA